MVLSGSGVEEVSNRAVVASLYCSDTRNIDRIYGLFTGYCPARGSYAYRAEPDRLHSAANKGPFKTGADYAHWRYPGPIRRDDKLLRFCGDCQYI